MGLRELILLEQLRNVMPRELEEYIAERQVATAQEAAELADQYEVIYRGTTGRGGPDKLRSAHGNRSEVRKPQGDPAGPSGGSAAGRSGFTGSRLERPGQRHFNHPAPRGRGSSYGSREIICHEFKRPGYIRSQCPGCPRDGVFAGVALVMLATAPLHGCESEKQVMLAKTCPYVHDAFISQGSMSVTEGGKEVPIRILRDTGAAQSLLLAEAMDLPVPSSTSKGVLLAGLGGEFGMVPLRDVYLQSDLVVSSVTVGIVLSVPVEGIDLLLGNDLAGAQVGANPVVSKVPCEEVGMIELE